MYVIEQRYDTVTGPWVNPPYRAEAPHTPTDSNDPVPQDEDIVSVTEIVEETMPDAEPDPEGLDDPDDDEEDDE